MKELNLQVTDELMGKIEQEAKYCLVTPEHYATCRLSMIFREKRPWGAQLLPTLAPVLESLAANFRDIMASQTEAEPENETKRGTGE